MADGYFDFFAAALDTTGDGTGTKIATVNGAVTPVPFMLKPGLGSYPSRIDIYRMIVHIGDAGIFSADDYGNISVLANGMEVEIRRRSDDATLIDLLGGLPVQRNSDWSRVSFDAEQDDYGSGENFLKVRWTFAKAGAPLRLTENNYLAVVVNDDLTGLVDHTFMVQGQQRVES